MLHQQIEQERAKDIALGGPVLELPVGVVALDLYSGPAVLEIVLEPR